MLVFIIQRLGQAAIVMLAVAVVSFSLFNFVGDPVNNMVGIETNEKERSEIRESLGLDDPIYVQFFSFVGNALRGQFGVSYRLTRPVTEIIMERMPATLELSLVAAVFALLVGIPMGVYTALYPGNWLSNIFLTVSLIGISSVGVKQCLSVGGLPACLACQAGKLSSCPQLPWAFSR